ncbi:MAG: putative ABC transporter permease [Clostridia bacterium]|nr:putative ABC transporter permease [Clostridia bacterium]
MAIYDVMMLFFTYSFLGWLGETIYVTVKRGHFANRGFTFGPFCFLYGFAGVVISVGFADAESAASVFLGSAVTATAMQLGAAKLLERVERKKWWDYSDKKWNYDGYVCLGYSVLWGVLGIIAVRLGNGTVLKLYSLLPGIAEKIIVWVLSVISAVDFIHSL